MPAPLTAPAWIVRARWAGVAFAGGLAFVAALRGDLGASVVGDANATLLAVVGLLALETASNAVLARHPERVVAALSFDVLLLTALLALTGGPSNPFSVVYFVLVVLTAVTRGPRATGLVWGLAVLAYGSLFLLPGDAHAAHRDMGFAGHLYGMWLAFALTGGLLGLFVARLSTELRASREQAARAARVASLTTLAAGTAHELGTPLGTIAVVAKELARALERSPDQTHLAEDAALIRREVDRCRAILDSMSGRAGDVVGEAPEAIAFAELAAAVRASLPAPRRERLDVAGQGSLRAPRQATVQKLTNLVENAFDASPPDARVTLRFDAGALEVVDTGAGMDAATAARAVEPFFSTKGGEGMGLGLFLAQATAEALGGRLAIDSRPGAGTRVRLELGGAA
ncbi:MAG: ATP-binding protein [Myxococcota bacterium]